MGGVALAVGRRGLRGPEGRRTAASSNPSRATTAPRAQGAAGAGEGTTERERKERTNAGVLPRE